MSGYDDASEPRYLAYELMVAIVGELLPFLGSSCSNSILFLCHENHTAYMVPDC